MGNELNDSERIVRLETKLDTELSAIKEALYDLKKIVMVREETYATKDVLEEKFKLRDDKIDGLQKAINEIRNEKQSNKNNLPVWLGIMPSVAAVIVAIIALYK